MGEEAVYERIFGKKLSASDWIVDPVSRPCNKSGDNRWRSTSSFIKYRKMSP